MQFQNSVAAYASNFVSECWLCFQRLFKLFAYVFELHIVLQYCVLQFKLPVFQLVLQSHEVVSELRSKRFKLVSTYNVIWLGFYPFPC